jgi:hypothetical protein
VRRRARVGEAIVEAPVSERRRLEGIGREALVPVGRRERRESGRRVGRGGRDGMDWRGRGRRAAGGRAQQERGERDAP